VKFELLYYMNWTGGACRSTQRNYQEGDLSKDRGGPWREGEDGCGEGRGGGWGGRGALQEQTRWDDGGGGGKYLVLFCCFVLLRTFFVFREREREREGKRGGGERARKRERRIDR